MKTAIAGSFLLPRHELYRFATTWLGEGVNFQFGGEAGG
jgi:hypothetical protein